MTAKYGDPGESQENYDKTLDKETALWLGRYVRRDVWDLDNMEITLQLYTNNGTTTLISMMNSKEYTDD